jgi:hypothetical protein
MELANFLEKIKSFNIRSNQSHWKLYHLESWVIIFIKKVKIQDFMGKTINFFGTVPFSPWAVLATWMHLGAPQNYMKNKLNTSKMK